MPSLAKRKCTYVGCSALVSSGRCELHQQLVDDSRQKTAERGYDADHKRLRVLCFERDEWRCVDCGWEPSIVALCRVSGVSLPPSWMVLEELREAYAHGGRHLHADHEIPIERRSDLRLDLENLRTRCNVCHSRKTAQEDGGFGNSIGWLAKRPKRFEYERGSSSVDVCK